MTYNPKKEYRTPENLSGANDSKRASRNRTGITLLRSPKRSHSLLSGNDAIILLEVINDSLSCKTQSEFIDLFTKLERLFLFDVAASALAKLDDKGTITSHDNINISYPDEWISVYCQEDFHKVDVVAAENFSTFTPQYWSDTYKKRFQPRTFLSAAESFGLERGYTHGSSPFGGWKEGSIFSFSSCSMNKYDPRIVTILTLIVPHLHRTLCSILNKTSSKSDMDRLTAREKDVLNWLKHGKSSWDISVILSISERTVNFHVYNIFKKLDVVNRCQAVAAAVYLGLIELD